ncbi:hypothetical protein [Acinetobacter towneri]|uniref:hypothetical protein n=1 Tax=Acinetobacter towneri TaxID=202956 RepID=UPI00398A3FED
MSTRRATRTPGAKEPEPTTQEQADQALEEILNDSSAGALVPAEQFDAVAQKLTETEDQLNKEREAVKKLTAEKDALLTQVKDLESKLKKQTAAEAKAAKAAEAKAEQPKE